MVARRYYFILLMEDEGYFGTDERKRAQAVADRVIAKMMTVPK